jgi:hypothetical protein
MMYDLHTGTLIVELQNPPELDLQLPSASVPTIAGTLG